MGLLKEALLVADKKTELQQDGLLKKAERAAFYSNSFHFWAKAEHFEHAALFQCISNNYVITHAKGIDAETITASVSSLDFFKGTFLSTEEWIYANAGTKAIEPYYQLLSQNFKDSIQKICFLKLSNEELSPVLMIIHLEGEKREALPDNINNSELKTHEMKTKLLSLIKETEFSPEEISEDDVHRFACRPASLLIISLKLAIQSFFQEKQVSSEIQKITETAIFNELFYFLHNSLCAHHLCCKGSGNEIKIALFSATETDTNFLQAFIAKLSVPYIGESAASKFVVLSAGKTENPSNIHKFLVKG